MTTYDTYLIELDGPSDDELKAIESQPAYELDWTEA